MILLDDVPRSVHEFSNVLTWREEYNKLENEGWGGIILALTGRACSVMNRVEWMMNEEFGQLTRSRVINGVQ